MTIETRDRSSNSNEQEFLEETLQVFTLAQKADKKGGTIKSTVDDLIGIPFAEAFRESDAFKSTTVELVKLLGVQREDDELKNISHRFSGAIFEKMAFFHFSQAQPENLTLLSPETTRKFYESLYAVSGEILPFEDGPLPPRGVRFPDGLLVTDEGKIDAICEYSLIGDRKYFQRKKLGLKRSKEDYPAMFDQTRIIVVAPQGNRRHTEDVEFIDMPINYLQFGEFINGVYSDLISGQNFADGIDFKLPQGVKDQLNQILDFSKNRSLDPKYRVPANPDEN